jgi:hypothetical protein
VWQMWHLASVLRLHSLHVASHPRVSHWPSTPFAHSTFLWCTFAHVWKILLYSVFYLHFAYCLRLDMKLYVCTGSMVFTQFFPHILANTTFRII